MDCYLQNHYFSSGTPADHDVALRIDQSLGLDPPITLTTRGLAFFWAPIENIVRSGYLPDVSQQVAGLGQFLDGSYMPTETGLNPKAHDLTQSGVFQSGVFLAKSLFN